MARKRPPGEGSIYQRKDGLWVGAITVGYTPRGNPRRKVVYGRTRQEVARKLAELQVLHHRGLLAEPAQITVRDWAEDWLKRKAAEVRPRTLESYRYHLAKAIPSLRDPTAYDRFGRMRLQSVQPLHVRRHLDGLRLTPHAMKNIRWLLHAVFEDAVRMELIHRNPVAPVKVKGPPRKSPGRTLEPDEARRLLAALDEHPSPLAIALRLMLTCGLRRGEALGLRWEDVDLEEGVLHVRRAWAKVGGKGVVSEPKTSSGYRAVPIPPTTLERLRAYRESVQGLSEEEARRSWLFPGRDPSQPVHPDAPDHFLRRLLARLGLPQVRVHDLRHTYGSLLLAQGAPVELVAERMGHANPNITLGIYRHLLEEERRGWVLDIG
ncbi:tyrosine-type recombinase/integrase [Thermus brockianus]|uniref:DNA integration/recombination/inversion protein n=1 Tax=Thermus brockianus TaxID=56956 RepID=A0A1J0LVS6_THEBO|nr:site-specific integrase [Thermus brockianus]APD09723.1 DNA integration/recombination/inversion protein [Thermus brockianus]